MIPYSPTSSVYHRNHRPHLRTFRPQAPILFEPNKSLTFANKSQRGSSSSLFITPVLVEVVTAQGEAQTRRSMPLHQSEYVKSACARRGRADGYSSSSGRLSSRDFRALTFCRYVRHCRGRLMTHRASLDCIAIPYSSIARLLVKTLGRASRNSRSLTSLS